ncbi:Glycoside hydrolase family 17 protein [Teratosphaeria destructans]|uniref:Probable beta-glucosidase btgE n=1 Tax=Teratosphaeria destructans TaxID=418781 RepID=A0A9W7SPN3_9PEZI|nr:Glycoside hydrolase family 17 protein [Teratosphaeria destructans]
MHSIIATLLASSALVCAFPHQGSFQHRHFHDKRDSAAVHEARDATSDLVIASGKKLAIAYTPFTTATKQTCKEKQDIQSDIQEIAAKGFSTVRIYGTNCQEHEHVGEAAKAHGLNIILGVDIGRPEEGNGIGSKYVDGIISDITTTYQRNGWWDIVTLVVYGNEAIFSGCTSVGSLASGFSATKALFKTAGYNGNFSTAEPMNIIAEHKDTLCPLMDVVGSNIHPFFNPQTTAASAGTFVASSLRDLAAYCPGGKAVINLETGWPSGPAGSGDPNHGPVAGPEQQKTAIKNIVDCAGDHSVILSWTDDMWKAPGEEQFWGVHSIFS